MRYPARKAQFLLGALIALAGAPHLGVCQSPAAVYRDPKAEVEARIDDLMRRMTPAEKAKLLNPAYWGTRPIERLGIPQLKMVNGSYGIRSGRATAFCSAVNLAASWDAGLVNRVGVALGKEVRAKGHNTLLGPVIYMHRIPQAGRNAESFSEDPHLAGKIVASYIRGIQSQKVVATAALFGCKAQEHMSHYFDARVDERTIHEIYLPAYKMAVQEGKVWAIMTAYNRVNGTYVSNHPYLLWDILKQRWGFQGLIMTDWAGVSNFRDAVYAGMDLDMPYGRAYTTDSLSRAFEGKDDRGKETWAIDPRPDYAIQAGRLNDSVRRVLRAMFSIGLFDPDPEPVTFDPAAHRALSLQAARESITLLKNDRNLLPLKRDKLKSIAVIGPNAGVARHSIQWASWVLPAVSVSPLEGIREKAGPGVAIRYSSGAEIEDTGQLLGDENVRTPDGRKGFLIEYFNNPDLQGAPAVTKVTRDVGFQWTDRRPEPEVTTDDYGIRVTGVWTPAQSGHYTLMVTGGELRKFHVGGLVNDVSGKLEDWEVARVRQLKYTYFKKGNSHPIRIEIGRGRTENRTLELRWKYREEKPLQNAVEAARQSDAVILCLGFSERLERENLDRSPGLPENQLELLAEVAKVNPKIVVVINAGSGLEMEPWQSKARAIVHAYYPGQEGGTALAEILFGDVNPSGRLPATCLKRWQDSPVYGHYPTGKDLQVRYVEGIYVGYRWFDREDTPDAAFPFGHGLSYTTFEYSDLSISPALTRTGNDVLISVKVRNTGERAGAEVVQMYLGDDHATVDRPVKELRGFQKVFLKAGEAATVRFAIRADDLKFYDVYTHDWKAEPGIFTAFIGSSAQDIRLRGKFRLAGMAE